MQNHAQRLKLNIDFVATVWVVQSREEVDIYQLEKSTTNLDVIQASSCDMGEAEHHLFKGEEISRNYAICSATCSSWNSN